MFDVERILAIPDESVDYLQMGISGGERAALEKRGFVRTDGIKAKDYMIRTIQKTAKNKAKAEKAIIKGDKKLVQSAEDKDALERLDRLVELGKEGNRADVAPKAKKQQLIPVDKVKPNILSSAELEQKGFSNIGVRQGFKKKYEALDYLKDRSDRNGGEKGLIDPDRYQIKGSGNTWYVYEKNNDEIPYKEFKDLKPQDAFSETKASELEVIKWQGKNGYDVYPENKKYTDKQRKELNELRAKVKRNERVQRLVSMHNNRPQDFDYLKSPKS